MMCVNGGQVQRTVSGVVPGLLCDFKRQERVVVFSSFCHMFFALSVINSCEQELWFLSGIV